MTTPQPDNDEGRPLAGPPSNVNNTDSHIVPLGTDVLRELDALAAHVDGAFVVVVKVNGPRYRRRCYLTAKAAENAARKAVERGEAATVYMAELKPLWRVSGYLPHSGRRGEAG
jgi:hypothetical protein